MTGWVYMVHSETGGAAQFPDGPGVVEAQQARGWERADMPAELDPDAPNTGLTAEQAQAAETAAKAEEEAAALHGKALDKALDDAELSKAGTVAEKQARLAEHEAESVNNNEEGNE